MLDAYVGTRLGIKIVLVVAATLEEKSLILPEKAKRVHVCESIDEGVKSDGP